MQTPGGEGTYYAGAIYAALASLAQAETNNPGSLNALIILSDGDASSCYKNGSVNTCGSSSTQMSTTGINSNGTYPSYKDQCQQAVTAAKSATSIPFTTVYTIAYGASSSGCSTDSPSISPCQALRNMATAPADFYSDATASQNKGQCTSASNPNLTLNQIFKSVATSFSVSQLLPASAWPSS
jgi:hypothetical protein